MRIFTIIALVCFTGFLAVAQLDTNLVGQIKVWRKGTPPPARLLKFPDGKIEMSPGCGMRVWGSAVEDYISKLEDVDLLAALIFDFHSQSETFHAALSRLITLRDVSYVSRLLADKRKVEPSWFARSELAVLAQLLRSPYIAIEVARIAPEDMPPEKAELVLRQMSAELKAGKTWTEAYS